MKVAHQDDKVAANDGRLMIRLFGSIAVELRGEVVVAKFRTRKTALLVGYLAASGHKRISRDQLVTLLWPEHDLNAARASLSTSLSAIRSTFGQSNLPQIIESDRQSVWLASHVDTDASEFDRLLTLANLSVEPERAVTWLRAAVERYTAPFLEGFDEDWVLAERQLRSDEYVRAVRRLVRLLTREGTLAEAIRMVRAAAQKEPIRESLTRDLMRLLWKAGEPSAALEAFRKLERTLHSTYELAPSPRTTDLADEIVSSLASEPREVKPTAHRLGRAVSRFIGRQKERSLIGSLLAKDEVRIVTVVGFGGIGKSRLSREVAVDLSESGEREVAWIPLDGYTSEDSVWAAIGLGFGLYSSTETIVIQFLQFSRKLLVIDNAEHLVPGIASPLRRLLEACPSIVLLITSRVPLRIDGECLVRLGPLAEQEGEDFDLFCDRLEAAHPGTSIPVHELAGLRAFIHRLGGIPLAIEMVAASTPVELLSHMHELNVEMGEFASSRPDHAGRHEFLSEVIQETFRKLTRPAQALLKKVWILDAGFTWPAARAALDESSSRAMSAIRELQDHSIVYSVETRHGHRFMTLRIVREVMLTSVPEAEQIDAIQWAVAWLNRGTEPEACLGYVSREITRNAVLELDNIVGVANHAVRTEQFELAADVLSPHTAAYRLCHHSPTLLKLAEVIIQRTDHLRQMQVACMASTLVLAGMDPEHWPTPIVERFYRLANESGDLRYIAVANVRKAYRTVWHYHDADTGIREVDEALAIPQECRSQMTGGLLEICAAEVLHGTVQYRRSLDIVEAMYARSGVRPGIEAEGYLSRVTAACTPLGLHDRAIEAAQKLRELAWESENLPLYAHSSYYEGFALLRAGRYEEALAVLDAGVDISKTYVPWDLTGANVHRICGAYACLALGRVEEAARRSAEVGKYEPVDVLFGVFGDDLNRSIETLIAVLGSQQTWKKLDIVASYFDYAANIFNRKGHERLAARMAGQADSMRSAWGLPMPLLCVRARGSLVPEPFETTNPKLAECYKPAALEAVAVLQSMCPELR